jgi:4-diphosphocytidyl-2-C-methyl-D-erythritol kinase
MKTLTASAPAKLNLTLRVGPLRGDGFHPLESLVTWIDFADQITFSLRDDDQIVIESDQPGIPTDDSNLVHRAARLLANAAGRSPGISIKLIKRIPPGMGLGGGSSNAATSLRGLNQLWETGQSTGRLCELAAEIGSDVPLFLHSPLSTMRGRGEIVEPVSQQLQAWVLLILPKLHCSTPAVYRAFDQLGDPPEHPALDAILGDLSADALMPLLFNDLEEPAFVVEPRLRELVSKVNERLGSPVRVTGSGAGCFRLYADAESASTAAEKLSDLDQAQIVVTQTITDG